jgi:hypothetical protein
LDHHTGCRRPGDLGLNDGVRVNIRPFVETGILWKNPNIKWTKDHEKESERDNDEYAHATAA